MPSAVKVIILVESDEGYKVLAEANIMEADVEQLTDLVEEMSL